jgi:hypothetical protein
MLIKPFCISHKARIVGQKTFASFLDNIKTILVYIQYAYYIGLRKESGLHGSKQNG